MDRRDLPCSRLVASRLLGGQQRADSCGLPHGHEGHHKGRWFEIEWKDEGPGTLPNVISWGQSRGIEEVQP